MPKPVEPVLPNHNFIGSFKYRIRQTPDLKALAQASGLFDRDAATIHVDPDQEGQMLRDTVVHESLHGMIWQTGLNDRWTKEEQEEVVSTLAPLVYRWIIDNAELMDWIAG